MHRLLTVMGSAVLAAALGVTALAQVGARFVLRNGQQFSGELIDMGTSGLEVRSSGQTRKWGIGEVAVVDFTGGPVTVEPNASADANFNMFAGAKQVTLLDAYAEKLGIARFDLLQVHNLLAWEEHLPTLLAMKAAGRVRYVGITTSEGRRHDGIERIMATPTRPHTTPSSAKAGISQ